MALRGARGGRNRSEGMATRAARPFCNESLEVDALLIYCFRREGHRGLHQAAFGNKYLEWRIRQVKKR